MKLKYINKIKANISISSNRKTTNILDGTYRSVYKGKSMNFENLREYVVNDDIKDIDWKASSRSGKLLIKQYIAEKKHNILFLMDTGKKMDADSNSSDSKKDLATFVAGTIGYLTIKNGDYIGMVYNCQDIIEYKQFKYSEYHLEQYLTDYNNDVVLLNKNGINKTLDFVYKNIKKRMIIFVITDLEGIKSIDEKIIKKMNISCDILFININDAYLNTINSYDVDSESYIPNIILSDKKIYEEERKLKDSIYISNQKKYKRLGINMITIEKISEINSKIIELLERHRLCK